MTDRIQTYGEFWPYYVMEHSRAVTRGLHYVGTTAGLTCLVLALAFGSPLLVPAGLACAYALAWASHFALERNRPATFRYPMWSFASDFRMLGLALCGEMGAEVERCRRVRSA